MLIFLAGGDACVPGHNMFFHFRRKGSLFFAYSQIIGNKFGKNEQFIVAFGVYSNPK